MMSENTIYFTVQKSLSKIDVKLLLGILIVLLVNKIQPLKAQNLVLQDTTITTTMVFSAKLISIGPNFALTNTGDVTLNATTVALIPEFSINRGGKLQVVLESAVGINVKSLIPSEFTMHQNFPNPFNPSTKILFNLPKTEHATLEVYNYLGQKVATLLDKKMNAGSHDVTFDASALPSGIYFYRIQVGDAPGRAGEFSQVRKMVFLK